MWKSLLLIAVIMLVIDLAYISLISGTFKSMVKEVQGGRKLELDLTASFLCYLTMVLALWYFIIREKRSVWEAALLGWSIYAVYETTNKATLKDWRWSMVVMDTLWGGVLFATTTFIFNTLPY